MTFSIAARCDRTGQLGVAVASHAFAVGAAAPWAVAGVGAGVTQSIPGAAHSAELTAMLVAGVAPPDAVRRLLGADDQAPLRQVGLVDTRGAAAGRTGTACVPFAGTATGDGVVAQGNMLAADGIWTAMAERFGLSTGDLASRLLDALRAGEKLGGDVRGRQSAALLVVDGEPGGERLVDVRVDDHHQPLVELGRLAALQHADRRMRAAIQGIVAGTSLDAVVADLREIQRGFGDNPEPTFWACVAGALAGRPDHERLSVLDAHPGWARLYERILAVRAAP
ncbi:DUF1028 domain-containing protein [Pseudonocardia sp. TRM90224]|uniref:DUF1028 domain-containing protein n=1 Tax=Pseudonocardia sp. TRM90224 TaxID=2812678 RepID=UPI001E541E91|nr:DUF1028 domain-containing protein [Pseudonocardia sp. TRM90224]